MFDDIIAYHIEHDKLSDATVHNLKQIAAHYDRISNDTLDKLRRVKAKYNFTNRSKIFPSPEEDTHLEFWIDSGGYDVVVMLADKTGVYDMDSDLGIIIREWEFDDYRDMGNDQGDLYYKIVDAIFYSWMAFNWQVVKGHETELAVKIIQNNSVSRFSLNDFAWEDLSKFEEFGDSAFLRSRFFKRDLELHELYSRADLKFSFTAIPEHIRKFSKNALRKLVSLTQGNVLIDGILIRHDHMHLRAGNYQRIKKTQIKYVECINELIQEGWLDCTYQE